MISQVILHMNLRKDNMMRKPSKSALAKGLDAECEKYADKEEVHVSGTIDYIYIYIKYANKEEVHVSD